MAISHRTQQARTAILRVLHAADAPVADRALRDLSRQHLTDSSWSELDLGDVIRDLELDGFIQGTTRDFDGQTVWMLTDKGQIQAKVLRR